MRLSFSSLKPSFCLTTVLVSFISSLPIGAQPAMPATGAEPYQILERGAHHRVGQSLQWESTALGRRVGASADIELTAAGTIAIDAGDFHLYRSR